MKVISAFAGLGGAELALKRAGIKTDIYAYEIDKYAEAVNRYNNPDSIFLGDITKWREHTNLIGDVDLIIGGSPCFTAGHFVMTINGAVPIENIQVGDYVLTHKGRYRKVLKTGSQIANDLRSISCQGEKDVITTDNHPFYIKRTKRRKQTSKESTWVKAKELIPSMDYLGVVQSDNTEYLEDNHSIDFWYFVGMFVASGWINKYYNKNHNKYSYRVVLNCKHNAFENTKEILNKIGYHYCVAKEETSYRFHITQKNLLEYLEVCGHGSINKRVHPDVWKLPIDKKKAFLEGYVACNGSYNKRYDITLAETISIRLAYELRQLVLDVYGTYSSIQSIQKAPCIIKNRVIANKNILYRVSFKDTYNDNLRYKKTDNYCWVPLRENYRLDITDTVYNLEVEEDNSYTINGLIVHNCQDLSIAGKRSGLQGSRSGLFYTFLEMLKYYKPKYFVLENVASMNNANRDIITELMGVEPVMFNAALVSAQQRKRLFWTNIPTSELEDKGIVVKDILESGDTGKDKIYCITATYCHAVPRDMLKNKRTQVFEEIGEWQSNKDKLNTITSAYNSCLEPSNVIYNNRPYLYKKIDISTPVRIGNIGNSTGQGNRVYSIKGKTVNINANGGGRGAKTGLYKIDLPDGKYLIRKLIPIEVERAFTIPDNYTKYGKFADGTIKEISDTQRYKMLGNGFVIDVIVEGILKNIGKVKYRIYNLCIEEFLVGNNE